MKRLIALIAMAETVVLLGLCISMRRLIVGCLALTGCWLLLKIGKHVSSLRSVVEWLGRRPAACLSLVLLAGVIVRAGLCCYSDWFFPKQYLFNQADYSYLDLCARAFAHGEWMHSKSWGTVVFYGIWYKLFGTTAQAAILASHVLYALATLFVYCLARRVAGVRWATFAALFVWLHPLVLLQSHWVATENVFTLLLAALLFFLSTTLRESRFVWRIVLSIGFGLLTWISIWTRSESLLFLVIFPSALILHGFVRHEKVKVVLVPLLAFGLVGAGCATFAREFNRREIGNSLVTCCNTSYLNRLFGANEESLGSWNEDDLELLWVEYCKNAPRFANMKWREYGRRPGVLSETTLYFIDCLPTEVVKFANEETARRWRSMSLSGAIRLMWKKVRVWRYEWNPSFVSFDRLGRRFCLIWWSQVAWAGFLLLLCAVTILRQRENVEFILWHAGPLIALLCGMTCILAISETCERYAWMLVIVLPLLAVGCFAGRKEGR